MTDQLELLSRAEQALAQADTVPDIVDIVDMAEAARILAQRAHLGQLAENRAALIKLRAQRKAGELLAQMRANGERSTGRGNAESQAVTPLAELGVTKMQSSRWQRLAQHFSDDELQILAERANEDGATPLSYGELNRRIRAQGQPAVPSARAVVTPPSFIDLIEETARAAFLLDPAATRTEIAGLAEKERAHVLTLLHQASLWLASLIDPIDLRRLELQAEMEASGPQRAAELRAELDSMFVDQHDIKPGDFVDHDGTDYVIERATDTEPDHEEPDQELDDNLDAVLCAFPGCELNDEHDGDHQIAGEGDTLSLSSYAKPPKDCGPAEQWCRSLIGSALDRSPADPDLRAMQHELYAGVDERRALEIRERLTQTRDGADDPGPTDDEIALDVDVPLTDYARPHISGSENRLRTLIAELPADNERVAEIQQVLYRGGVTIADASPLLRELKQLHAELVPTKV